MFSSRCTCSGINLSGHTIFHSLSLSALSSDKYEIAPFVHSPKLSVSQLGPENCKMFPFFSFFLLVGLATAYVTACSGLHKIKMRQPFLSFLLENALYLCRLDLINKKCNNKNRNI